MIDAANDDNTEVFDLQGATQRARRLLHSGVKDEGGDAEGVVGHPSYLSKYNNASTVILCKDIASILMEQYPGWAWTVEPDERGGVINIRNLHCHNSLGYTIHGDQLDDPSVRRKAVTNGGGELLERFGMPFKMDSAKLAEAPRDARGMLIPDLVGLNMAKQKRDAEIAMKLATGEWEIVETSQGRYIRSNR